MLSFAGLWSALKRGRRLRRAGLTPRAGAILGAALIDALAMGAGAMYLLDPSQGRARRARLRDKILRSRRTVRGAVGKGVRDLENRAQGLVAEGMRAQRDEPISDERLAQYVRAEIGRCVSHPGSIELEARDGCITLTGPILRREHRILLRAVGKLRGVKDIEDLLEVHKRPGNIPGLQGEPARSSRQPTESWAPGPRLLAALVGGALGAVCAVRRGLTGTAAGMLGSTLLLRALTNQPATRLFGLRSGRRLIDLQKTIEIEAPLDAVYALWRNFENFPRFMQHVRDITVSPDGRSHWRVAGPAGATVEWDAEISADLANELLAWRTLPDQAIEHAGIVRFEPTPRGTTRLSVRMSYRPPAGVLGHAVASLLGGNPKKAMDEDLVRFKSLLEQGKTRAHGQETRLEEALPRTEPRTGAAPAPQDPDTIGRRA